MKKISTREITIKSIIIVFNCLKKELKFIKKSEHHFSGSKGLLHLLTGLPLVNQSDSLTSLVFPTFSKVTISLLAKRAIIL